MHSEAFGITSITTFHKKQSKLDTLRELDQGTLKVETFIKVMILVIPTLR